MRSIAAIGMPMLLIGLQVNFTNFQAKLMKKFSPMDSTAPAASGKTTTWRTGLENKVGSQTSLKRSHLLSWRIGKVGAGFKPAPTSYTKWRAEK